MTHSAGGIVLCGGASRRMGQPKAWLPFGDVTLLERLVQILGEVVKPIVVVAAPGQDLPDLPVDVEIIRDERQGRGPLQGLAAGLRRFERLGIESAYASSTDAPFLKSEFIRRVLALMGDSLIAVPFVEDRHHPLAAAYRTVCLPVIDNLLEMDRLRPIYVFDEVRTRVIDAAELADVDPTFQSLRNLNTPEDYQRALQDLMGEI